MRHQSGSGFRSSSPMTSTCGSRSALPCEMSVPSLCRSCACWAKSKAEKGTATQVIMSQVFTYQIVAKLLAIAVIFAEIPAPLQQDTRVLPPANQRRPSGEGRSHTSRLPRKQVRRRSREKPRKRVLTAQTDVLIVPGVSVLLADPFFRL